MNTPECSPFFDGVGFCQRPEYFYRQCCSKICITVTGDAGMALCFSKWHTRRWFPICRAFGGRYRVVHLPRETPLFIHLAPVVKPNRLMTVTGLNLELRPIIPGLITFKSIESDLLVLRNSSLKNWLESYRNRPSQSGRGFYCPNQSNLMGVRP